MLRGVGVKVAVEVAGGMAAIVCVDAAAAVCTINVPIAFGSSGGMGVGVIKVGTHPMIKDRVVKQINSFILDDAILPLVSRDDVLLFYNLFYTSNGSTFQADFDPVRMGRGFRQDVPDRPRGQRPRALILLQDDHDLHAGRDVVANASVHLTTPHLPFLSHREVKRNHPARDPP